MICCGQNLWVGLGACGWVLRGGWKVAPVRQPRALLFTPVFTPAGVSECSRALYAFAHHIRHIPRHTGHRHRRTGHRTPLSALSLSLVACAWCWSLAPVAVGGHAPRATRSPTRHGPRRGGCPCAARKKQRRRGELDIWTEGPYSYLLSPRTAPHQHTAHAQTHATRRGAVRTPCGL